MPKRRRAPPAVTRARRIFSGLNTGVSCVHSRPFAYETSSGRSGHWWKRRPSSKPCHHCKEVTCRCIGVSRSAAGGETSSPVESVGGEHEDRLGAHRGLHALGSTGRGHTGGCAGSCLCTRFDRHQWGEVPGNSLRRGRPPATGGTRRAFRLTSPPAKGGCTRCNRRVRQAEAASPSARAFRAARGTGTCPGRGGFRCVIPSRQLADYSSSRLPPALLLWDTSNSRLAMDSSYLCLKYRKISRPLAISGTAR